MAKKKEQKHSVPKITVKIDRMTNPEAKIKAYASVNIGGAFIVKDIAVMDNKNGLFARMPCRSYKDGKGEMQYSDTVFALTAEARTALNNAVVSAYEEQLNMQENESDEECSSCKKTWISLDFFRFYRYPVSRGE